jgi:hypothetical protein
MAVEQCCSPEVRVDPPMPPLLRAKWMAKAMRPKMMPKPMAIRRASDGKI